MGDKCLLGLHAIDHPDRTLIRSAIASIIVISVAFFRAVRPSRIARSGRLSRRASHACANFTEAKADIRTLRLASSILWARLNMMKRNRRTESQPQGGIVLYCRRPVPRAQKNARYLYFPACGASLVSANT